MNRRSCLCLLAATLATPVAAQQSAAVRPITHHLQSAWQAWKELCLMPDGRIVDGFQEGASHSEGQGYGLVLAAMFGDQAACRAIVDWTMRHLAVRDDALLAWRWRPDTNPQIADMNNASDGDIFFAWGLLLAANLIDMPEWRRRAGTIARDLDRLCLIDSPDGRGGILLLPAAEGFVRDEGILVNPSYYMPLAMAQIASATDTPRLARAASSGMALIDSLGELGPVPDWVLISPSGPGVPPEVFSRLSGYEAVRVALFALWSGHSRSPAVRAHVDAVAGAGAGPTPTRIDPQTGQVIERSEHPGYAAVAQLAACASSDGVGSLIPHFDSDQPYYPATLHLMSLLVQITTYPRCVPI